MVMMVVYRGDRCAGCECCFHGCFPRYDQDFRINVATVVVRESFRVDVFDSGVV